MESDDTEISRTGQSARGQLKGRSRKYVSGKDEQ